MLRVRGIELNAGSRKKEYIRDFFAFIKPEIALFITSIAAVGYILFNPLDFTLIYALLTVFFATTAAYICNHFTDKKEDMLNKKRLNLFVVTGAGYVFLAGSVILSFVFSLFLPRGAFILYLALLAGGVFYSISRIKKRVLFLKNIYTATIMTLTFLIGALAGSSTDDVVFFVVPIYLITLSVSLIGDLRDFFGDRIAGIRTVAVVFGYDVAKKLVYAILILLLCLNLSIYQVLLPSSLFVLLCLFFLHKDNIRMARISILSSLIFLPLFLGIAKTIGGS